MDDDLQPPPASLIRVLPGPDPGTVRFVLGRKPLRYASHLAPMALGLFALWNLAQMDASHAEWLRSLPAASRVERFGASGAVNVSGNAWEQVAHVYRSESLGLFDVKGIAPIEIRQILPAE